MNNKLSQDIHAAVKEIELNLMDMAAYMRPGVAELAAKMVCSLTRIKRLADRVKEQRLQQAFKNGELANDRAVEIDRLSRHASAYQLLIKSLEEQREHLRRESRQARESIETLNSERQANAILTAEIERLNAQVCAMYPAWHSIGADVAGLKWADFVTALDRLAEPPPTGARGETAMEELQKEAQERGEYK